MLRITNIKDITMSLLGKNFFSTHAKQDAIICALCNASVSRGMGKGKPGEIIECLDKETRDILKDCKPEDWYHRLESVKWMID